MVIFMDNHEEFVASCVLYAFYSEVEHMDRDSDSFMHYGRIGMKWHQHIFGDDTRIGRMKKAASKAADSLRGLEAYGDKMREGVARFKTQTRAEANRWRMDNGYQKDSYKEYHKEKAAKEAARRAENNAVRDGNRKWDYTLFNEDNSYGNRPWLGIMHAMDGKRVRNLASDFGIDGDTIEKLGRSISHAGRRASEAVLQKKKINGSADFINSSKKLLSQYRKASDKVHAWEQLALSTSHPNSYSKLLQMANAARGGLLESAYRFSIAAEAIDGDDAYPSEGRPTYLRNDKEYTSQQSSVLEDMLRYRMF